LAQRLLRSLASVRLGCALRWNSGACRQLAPRAINAHILRVVVRSPALWTALSLSPAGPPSGLAGAPLCAQCRRDHRWQPAASWLARWRGPAAEQTAAPAAVGAASSRYQDFPGIEPHHASYEGQACIMCSDATCWRSNVCCRCAASLCNNEESHRHQSFNNRVGERGGRKESRSYRAAGERE
jgi:hypothetical protein